eukprot:2612191-Prorocentrum_lima.AAC.1
MRAMTRSSTSGPPSRRQKQTICPRGRTSCQTKGWEDRSQFSDLRGSTQQRWQHSRWPPSWARQRPG